MYIKIKPTKFVFSVFFITALVAFGFLAFIKKSHASTPFSNTYDFYTTSSVGIAGSESVFFNFPSSTIGEWSGNLDGVWVNYQIPSIEGSGLIFQFGVVDDPLAGCPTVTFGNRRVDLPARSSSTPYYIDFVNDSVNTGPNSTGTLPLSTSSYYGFRFSAIPNGVSLSLTGNSPASLYDSDTYGAFYNGGGCSENDFFPYIILGSSVPDLTGHVEVLFPHDQEVLPDFSTWVLGLSDLEIGQVYYGTVFYAPSSTDPSAQNYYYQDSFSVISSSSSVIWTVPKFNRLPDDPTSTIGYFDTWEVLAQLFSDSSFQNLVASSPVISFTPDRSQPNPTSTYSNLVEEFYHAPIFSDREECGELTFNFFSDTPIKNIGCMIRNAFLDFMDSLGNLVNKTMDAGLNKLVTLIRKVFPFREISAMNDIINDVQEATSTFSVTLSGNGLWGGHSFSIINASSSSWIEERMGFDYRDLIGKILYALTLVIVILTTIKILKTTHDSSTKK